jgi:osmotically-inducible protein OsmY
MGHYSKPGVRSRRGRQDTTAAVRDTSADAATTAKAKAALALSKRVSALEVNVDTTNAIVTLSGRVPTPEAKELAGQIVADTSGVRDVRNLLTVDVNMRPEQERERLARRVTDLETQTALSEALQESRELDGAKVKVRVVDGAVTLEGTVASGAQKAQAEELVPTFQSVQRLSNRLK